MLDKQVQEDSNRRLHFSPPTFLHAHDLFSLHIIISKTVIIFPTIIKRLVVWYSQYHRLIQAVFDGPWFLYCVLVISVFSSHIVKDNMLRSEIYNV